MALVVRRLTQTPDLGVAPATGTHPLRGRCVVVATMHGKEAVLGPPLRAALGVEIVVPNGFDTDRFGTFTGSVPRRDTALEAARQKAHAALQLGGTSTAVASEGSFGPHPASPFLTIGAELVLLCDVELGLEVVAEDVGTATNFAARAVASLDEARSFAEQVGFPSHQLVVAPPGRLEAGERGLGDEASFAAALSRQFDLHGRALVATDMRADRNPTRLQAIARAAQRLAERAATLCPACRWPGFGRVRVEPGLPCGACGEPTERVRAEVFGCARCPEQRVQARRDGLVVADPGECSACNP